MGRGRTATTTAACNTSSTATSNALGMQSKGSRILEKTNEKDQPPPDESDDSSHDSGARKTRRSTQAISKEQTAITQNKSTKPVNLRSRLRKTTQLNHTSSVNLAESRTQKSFSYNSNNRTDEILVVSDGILMKNSVYEGIHSNHIESKTDEFPNVANDENVVNVVEISDETDNLSMDTDTITTESSLMPDSNDTTCSADDEAESSIFSEDSQTRSSSIITVTPEDSNSMQAVDGGKQKDADSAKNLIATLNNQAIKIDSSSKGQGSDKSNLENLTSSTTEIAEISKTPEKPTQPAPDSDDRLLSSPDFFNLPKPKIVRTYQNRRKLRAEAIKKQENETLQDGKPIAASACAGSEVPKSSADKTKSPESVQTNEKQEVTECRRSQRQRIIKYEVRDLFNLKGSRNQTESKNQNNAYKSIKDSPRSELSSSPQTFRGFSDTDDPSSPIHFAARPFSRQSNATPTPPPRLIDKDFGKAVKTNLAEKFLNAFKVPDIFDIQNSEALQVASEEERVRSETSLISPLNRESSEEAKTSKNELKKEVRKAVRILPRRKTVLLNRAAHESENNSDSSELEKQSTEKSVENKVKDIDSSKSVPELLDNANAKAITEPEVPTKSEAKKQIVSPSKTRKSMKIIDDSTPRNLSVESPYRNSNIQCDLGNEPSLNTVSVASSSFQVESKKPDSLTPSKKIDSQPCADLQQMSVDPEVQTPLTTKSDLKISPKISTISEPSTACEQKTSPKEELTVNELEFEGSPKNSKKRGRPLKTRTEPPQTIQPSTSSLESNVDQNSSHSVHVMGQQIRDMTPEKQKPRKSRTPKKPKTPVNTKCDTPTVEVKQTLANDEESPNAKIQVVENVTTKGNTTPSDSITFVGKVKEETNNQADNTTDETPASGSKPILDDSDVTPKKQKPRKPRMSPKKPKNLLNSKSNSPTVEVKPSLTNDEKSPIPEIQISENCTTKENTIPANSATFANKLNEVTKNEAEDKTVVTPTTASTSLLQDSDVTPKKQKPRKPRMPKKPKNSLSSEPNTPTVEVKSKIGNEEISPNAENQVVENRTAKEDVTSTDSPTFVEKNQYENHQDQVKEHTNIEANDKTVQTVAIPLKPTFDHSLITIQETTSDEVKSPDKKKAAAKRPRTKGEMKLIEESTEIANSNSNKKSLQKTSKLVTPPKSKKQKKVLKPELTESEKHATEQSDVRKHQYGNVPSTSTRTINKAEQVEKINKSSEKLKNELKKSQSPIEDINIKEIFDQARANIARSTLDCGALLGLDSEALPSTDSKVLFGLDSKPLLAQDCEALPYPESKSLPVLDAETPLILDELMKQETNASVKLVAKCESINKKDVDAKSSKFGKQDVNPTDGDANKVPKLESKQSSQDGSDIVPLLETECGSSKKKNKARKDPVRTNRKENKKILEVQRQQEDSAGQTLINFTDGIVPDKDLPMAVQNKTEQIAIDSKRGEIKVDKKTKIDSIKKADLKCTLEDVKKVIDSIETKGDDSEVSMESTEKSKMKKTKRKSKEITPSQLSKESKKNAKKEVKLPDEPEVASVPLKSKSMNKSLEPLRPESGLGETKNRDDSISLPENVGNKNVKRNSLKKGASLDKSVTKKDFESETKSKNKTKLVETKAKTLSKKEKTEAKTERSKSPENDKISLKKVKSKDDKSQTKSRKKRSDINSSSNDKLSNESDSNSSLAKSFKCETESGPNAQISSKLKEHINKGDRKSETNSSSGANEDILKTKQESKNEPLENNSQIQEPSVVSNADDTSKKSIKTVEKPRQEKSATLLSEANLSKIVAEKSKSIDLSTANKPKQRTRASRWDQEYANIPKATTSNERPIVTEKSKKPDENINLEPPVSVSNLEKEKVTATKRKSRFSKSHSTSDGISDNYSSDSSDSRQTSRTRSSKLNNLSLPAAGNLGLDTMLDPTSIKSLPPASNLSSVLNGLSKAVMNDLLEWTCNNKQTVLQIKDTIDHNQKTILNAKSVEESTSKSGKVEDLAFEKPKDVTREILSLDKNVTSEKLPNKELSTQTKTDTEEPSKVAPIIQTSKEMLAELMSDSLDADTDHFSESSQTSPKLEAARKIDSSQTLDTSSNVSDKSSDLELSTKSDSETIDQSSQDSSANIRRSHRIKTQVKTTVGRGLVRKSDRNQNSTSALDLEAQNAKFLKDMEERLSQFQMIKENEYKCERIISREAKRMTCDCFLTRDEEQRGELGCGEDCLNRLLMIECSGNCTVGDRCTNRRFQKNLYAPCKVFRTEKKGFGILADGEIGPGEFVMEYVGEVLNGKQFEKRAAIYSQDKNKHYYFMALRGDSIIDATMKGNISRFINHSCDPNAETQKWTVNGELRIGFFSKRRIFPGEEITFDYQFQRYGKEAQKCYCESANCRGWIGEEPESEDEEEVTSSESEEEVEDKQPVQIEDKEKEKQVEPDIVEKIIAPKDVIQPAEDITKLPSVEVSTTEEPVKVPEIVVPAPKSTEKEIAERKALKAAERYARIAAKIKARKERERLKQQARMALEDPDLEAQISSLEKTGLKNQPLTLKLSRCMVRAKYLQSKLRIFDILQKGEMACRRLFLDYHGLRLLHGWMSEIETTDVEQDLEFRQKTLETLERLPIPNITILKDSKVFDVVQSWGDEMTQKILLESNSEEKSPPHKKQKTDEENYLDIRKQIKTLAIRLITSWEVLPEVFRIPKRERIEQMKEHEREADRQYKALNLGDDDQYKTELRNKERFGAKKSYKWVRDKYDRRKENATKESEKVNSAEANLTKLQRRQLFAAKVAKDEAEKRLAEIRREFEFKCKFYGLDPRYMTPNTMPFCVHPPTGQWYSKEKKKIPTPPSHAHIKVPPKPQSTDPKDYKMPEMDLPPMWKFAMDPRGRVYYYHIKIRIPQWEPPIKILPLTTDPTLEATTSTASESDGKLSTNVNPAMIDPQPSTSKQALAAAAEASSTECEDTDSDISCSDIIGLKKGVPLKIGKEMIEELKRSRKRKRFTRLVQERTISPRREEDRLYNQIEMRKYRENKEKIRRRKEEIKRRKALFRNEEDSSTNSKDNGMLLGASTSKAALENLSIPIQDYLLSSDEDDLGKSDYDISLIEKIVHGDKIVDELDAIAKEKPLKRPLPFVKDHLDVKKRIKLDDSKKRLESSKSDKFSKSRKAESGSSKYASRKAREKFRIDIAGIIVHHLAPYRRDSCSIGKITNNEDFKHLARKLTHFVLIKELKHCDLTGQTLIVTESVKNKSREFIKKYMAKYGRVYVRPANDPEFRDIPL